LIEFQAARSFATTDLLSLRSPHTHVDPTSQRANRAGTNSVPHLAGRWRSCVRFSKPCLRFRNQWLRTMPSESPLTTPSRVRGDAENLVPLASASIPAQHSAKLRMAPDCRSFSRDARWQERSKQVREIASQIVSTGCNRPAGGPQYAEGYRRQRRADGLLAK
jgi:hypothetical protein